MIKNKIIIFSIAAVLAVGVFAPANVGANGGDDHTAAEEAAGKAIWDQLQGKATTCKELKEEDFAALGEYFMGAMMGDAHEAMNNMMVQMLGESGEVEMHAVMGKRLSGCDTSATFAPRAAGFIPMMHMFGPLGLGGMPYGMNTYGIGIFGWLVMVLWWALTVIGALAAIKWIVGRKWNGKDSKD